MSQNILNYSLEEYFIKESLIESNVCVGSTIGCSMA